MEGGSLDRVWAERLEQAKMFSDLSLLRENTLWRTLNLVYSPSDLNIDPKIKQSLTETMFSVYNLFLNEY